MDLALLLLRILLAGVFLTAGVAKLVDLSGSRRAVAEFGVSERFAGSVGVLLPVAELAVAVALIVSATARYGALAALILLLTFVVAIGVALVRGKQADCHCFGQLHSGPVGWPTLLRNLVLAGAAGVALAGGRRASGLSPLGWVSGLSAAELALAATSLVLVCAAAVQGWFLLELLGQHGRILVRLDVLEGGLARAGAPGSRSQAPPPGANGASAGNGNGRRPGLAVGSQAPEFELPSVAGARVCS